jgi:hypothetical protein
MQVRGAAERSGRNDAKVELHCSQCDAAHLAAKSCPWAAVKLDRRHRNGSPNEARWRLVARTKTPANTRRCNPIATGA